MELLIPICIGIVTGIIAARKGRSGIGWFFIGSLFPPIGLILVIVVSSVEDEKRFRGQTEDENRRLREQLRQTRMRLEQVQHQTEGRLTLIDQHLGIDTSIPELASTPAAPPAPGSGLAPAPLAQAPARSWYYEQGGETRGPVSQEALGGMLASGQLRRSNLVWAQHLPDWRPAGDTPEFRQLA